jgi:3-dehydroquinate dehydratase-2
MATILVLHGPNMGLKGLEALDESLEERAEVLALSLLTAQSNGEAGLLDALLAEAGEVDGVLVNPGVLAPSAWALAEALTLLAKPAVEVLLTALPSGRGPSALAGAVLAQVHGEGPAGYLAGLERLAAQLGAGAAKAADDDDDDAVTAPRPALRRPGVGRAAAVEPDDEHDDEAPRPAVRRAGATRPAPPKPPTRAPVPPPAAARSAKTLGRKASPPPPAAAPALGKSLGRRSAASPAPAFAGLSRAAVKQRLEARLAGSLSPAELATWARGEWSALQKGGPCEPGWRDRLDAVLLTLMATGKGSDHLVLAQLARLDG